jgi:hypothetical protein
MKKPESRCGDPRRHGELQEGTTVALRKDNGQQQPPAGQKKHRTNPVVEQAQCRNQPKLASSKQNWLAARRRKMMGRRREPGKGR